MAYALLSEGSFEREPSPAFTLRCKALLSPRRTSGCARWNRRQNHTSSSVEVYVEDVDELSKSILFAQTYYELFHYEQHVWGAELTQSALSPEKMRGWLWFSPLHFVPLQWWLKTKPRGNPHRMIKVMRRCLCATCGGNLGSYLRARFWELRSSLTGWGAATSAGRVSSIKHFLSELRDRHVLVRTSTQRWSLISTTKDFCVRDLEFLKRKSWRRFHRTCFYASRSLRHPARDISPIHWSDYTLCYSEHGHTEVVPKAFDATWAKWAYSTSRSLLTPKLDIEKSIDL